MAKRAVLRIVLVLAPFLLLELGVRVWYAFQVGPSVLAYGTPLHRKRVETPTEPSEIRPEAKHFKESMDSKEWRTRRTVVKPQLRLSGYFKYFPNQKRVDFDVETGEPFDVTINRQGFRGRDHDFAKPPGVIRVVALGASSTFGYFNRDDETWPILLEGILNDRAAGSEGFEIVNLGIPHLKSASIRALFLAEGLAYDPDVVVFYEGNNDAGRIREPRADLPTSILRRAGEWSIVVGLADSILEHRLTASYRPEDIDAQAERISAGFVENVAEIRAECARRGIVFIVANQQSNSQTVDRADLEGLRYEAEQAQVRARLLRSEPLANRELRFLTHGTIMRDLEAWALSNDVPFIDVIERLDQHREVLVSWVHLSPRGNRMIAEAFADEILRSSPRAARAVAARAGE